jgi:hypothetical protein
VKLSRAALASVRVRPAADRTILHTLHNDESPYPRSRFLVSGTGGKEQTLEPIPAERIAGKIRRRAMWANVLRAFAAGMATKQVTSTFQTSGNVSVFGPGGSAMGTYGETTTTTTTVPDREAQRNAAETNARATDEANRRAEGAVRYALKANTLFPGNALEGVIYFERKKSEKSRFSSCN